jgi:hypothetical protein
MGIWSDWYEKNAGKEGCLTSAEFVLKKIDESIKKMWPVGSIYMSVNNANPSIYFPGTTWTAWGSGRVPVGVNEGDADFGTVEKTGGEKTSTNTSSGSGTSGSTAISIAQMPNHNHQFKYRQMGITTGNWAANITEKDAPNGAEDKVTYTEFTGGGQGHTHSTPNHQHTVSILQPYITCYMWKRTT